MLNLKPSTLTLAQAAAPSGSSSNAQSPTAPPPSSLAPAPSSDSNSNQTTTGQPSNPGATGKNSANNQSADGFGGSFLIIVILVIVVMWVFMLGGQRKQKKKRKQMLDQVSKGAKVQTIGGIIGTVIDVKDNEIVVKVDENANTKLRFSRSAVQTVLEEKEE